MQPEAIIFDLDGTIVDTEPVWDQARRALAKELEVPWPKGATRAMMGMSTVEWSNYLVAEVGLPMSADAAADATIQQMVAYYRNGVTLLPGAVAAVRRMGKRYRIGIATSSPRVLLDTAIQVLGLGDLVEASVSTEEVAKGKPSPDAYLRVCELLAVKPERCLAIEDSTNGIKSALAAGLKVVAVPMKLHPPKAELLARTRVVDSLIELTRKLVEKLPD